MPLLYGGAASPPRAGGQSPTCAQPGPNQSRGQPLVAFLSFSPFCARLAGAVGARARAGRQVDLAPRPDAGRARHRPHHHLGPARGRGRAQHRQGGRRHGLPGAQAGQHVGGAGPRRRRPRPARGRHRLRQLRHRPAPDDGAGGRPRHARALRRRRLAVAPAHGPHSQAARPDGPRHRGARPRPAAARHPRQRRPAAHRVCPARRLGADQVGRAAGRAACGRRHDRGGGAGDPRPHRAHAAPLRGRGRRRRAQRRAHRHGDGRCRAFRARRQRAGRSELGRLPHRRRADRAGLGDRHRGRARQPDAHRLLHHAARDGRRRDIRQRARGGGRAGRRYPRAPFAARRACACRRSAHPA